MKLITPFLLAVFALIQLKAQQLNNSIALDQNGNIYIATSTSHKLKFGGKTILNNKQNSIVLLKLDRQGSLLDQITIDSTQSAPCLIAVDDKAIYAAYVDENHGVLNLFSADSNFENVWRQEFKTPKNDGIISIETDLDNVKIGFKLTSENEVANFGIAYLEKSNSKSQRLEIIAIKNSLGFQYHNDVTANEWSYEIDENRRISVNGDNYFRLISNSQNSDHESTTEIISGSLENKLSNTPLFYLQKGQISSPKWSLSSIPEHSSFGTDYTVGIDGSVFAVGTFENVFKVDESALMSGGSLDAFILKTSADGKLKWMMNFGGDHEDRAISITKTIDSNLLIAVAINCSSTTANQTLLLCIDQDGNVIWQNQILSSK